MRNGKVTNYATRSQKDNRSFFEKLQNAEGLDLRDNRGKKHKLAIVLVGVGLAVLSHRDGSLSSIRRHLANHYEKLAVVLGVEKKATCFTFSIATNFRKSGG